MSKFIHMLHIRCMYKNLKGGEGGSKKRSLGQTQVMLRIVMNSQI